VELIGVGNVNDMTDMIQGQRAMREALLRDPHRPTWHFVSPEGHCMPFDPNGAIWWNGRYHLCYIFQDQRGHCWGHASSHDLVHWRWHEPALVPAPGDVDRGIFSGNCFVNKDGAATMLYHGVDAGNCIATSADPNLDRWAKLPTNPIVPNPKLGSPESKLYNSWDPHGWLEGDMYYAIFGGNPGLPRRRPGEPGTCTPPALFKGKSLDQWTFVGPFMAHDMPDVADFEDVSCPDFFPLGDKHVLVCISHACGARYYVGRWENEKFYPELHRRMNWPGGACFAPETLRDGKGRRILWTWALEARSWDKFAWSGVMTLPRVLSLAPDHTLFIDPIEELRQLRTKPRTRRGVRVKPNCPVRLEEIRGDSLELELMIRPGSAKRFGLKVRCSPGGEEETVIWCDPAAGVLRIDVAKASLDPDVVYRTYAMRQGDNPTVTAQEAPFALAASEPLTLRVFLDRSILEIFANRKQCLTQRIYPTRTDSLDIVLVSEGGECQVESINAWEMAPASAW
jgi:sucrose-6-phosphate hydrolase SacC (GH32 family)